MYSSVYDRWPKGLYIPTQKQIDWLRSGEWDHSYDAVRYARGYGKTSILEREISRLVREGKPGHRIVVEKLTFGTIITRYEKV